MQSRTPIESAFAEHRKLLWGLCYRMVGSAADADDLVQHTFERALSSPPPDTTRELRPWLVRVAMNAARDHLRRRRRREYVGPWLPAPVPTGPGAELLALDEGPEARYGQLESVGFAFLRAAEALTPNQRAVLILRDVLDLSVRETAEALELSEPNVKTTLHRARAAMRDYDGRRRPPSDAERARARRVLEAFLMHLLANNVDALRELLAEDVVAHNDGAGERIAARRPVVGRDKVLMFHRRTMRASWRMAWCEVNGTQALIFDAPHDKPGYPRYVLVWVELDDAGRIAELNWQVAPRKLKALPWQSLALPSPRDLLAALGSAVVEPPPAQWALPAARRLLRGVGQRLR